MKAFTWKRLGFTLAILAILLGNLLGLSALANGDGDKINTTGSDDPPPGVLVGYTPSVEQTKVGEHFEYIGWVGAPFGFLVTDYKYFLCCKRTYREMDGCKDLKICPPQS